MHRLPREENSYELRAEDDDDDDNASNHLTYKKAFFRISKFVPMKNINDSVGLPGTQDAGTIGGDDSTVMSDISARTKDFFSKPDHEWRTKFLLQVSRVAITEIKNEKEVFFEAWDNMNGEVIERSLVFKTVGQAKEFSYDLERLANEDPEMNEILGGSGHPLVAPQDMVISTAATTIKEDPKEEDERETISQKKEESNSNYKNGDRKVSSVPLLQEQNTTRQSVLSTTISSQASQSPHEDIETGNRSMTVQPSTINNTNNSKRCCHAFIFVLTDIINFLGLIAALGIFFYSIAIMTYDPEPLYVVGISLCGWAIFIAFTYGSGILGIHEICCGGSCCINFSLVLGIFSVLLHGAAVVVIDVREDRVFDYLKTNYEKLFLNESIVEYLRTKLLLVFIVIVSWCVIESIR